MQQYLEILQTCRLFAEIPPDSLKTMLECFAPTIQTYAKQQTLLHAGEPLHHLGIVLTGKVQLVRLDYDGNRSITASLSICFSSGSCMSIVSFLSAMDVVLKPIL